MQFQRKVVIYLSRTTHLSFRPLTANWNEQALCNAICCNKMIFGYSRVVCYTIMENEHSARSERVHLGGASLVCGLKQGTKGKGEGTREPHSLPRPELGNQPTITVTWASKTWHAHTLFQTFWIRFPNRWSPGVGRRDPMSFLEAKLCLQSTCG